MRDLSIVWPERAQCGVHPVVATAESAHSRVKANEACNRHVWDESQQTSPSTLLVRSSHVWFNCCHKPRAKSEPRENKKIVLKLSSFTRIFYILFVKSATTNLRLNCLIFSAHLSLAFILYPTIAMWPTQLIVWKTLSSPMIGLVIIVINARFLLLYSSQLRMLNRFSFTIVSAFFYNSINVRCSPSIFGPPN